MNDQTILIYLAHIVPYNCTEIGKAKHQNNNWVGEI